MKRTLKYALSATLCFGVVAPVLAQGRPVPPDVSETHWAYDALKELFNKGLLKGYPDGLFRGPRPASRYEMAYALHSLYDYLMKLNNGQQRQIDDLIARLGRVESRPQTGADHSADIRAIRDELARMKNQNDEMAKWKPEIDNLKRMASTFERELSRLGVDVEQMKKDLSGLSGRMDELEKRLNVQVNGTIDFVTISGKGQSGNQPITVDGRLPGMVPGFPINRSGLITGATAFHEAAITMKGTNKEGPKWQGTFVYGNMLSAPAVTNGLFHDGFGTQGTITAGAAYQEGAGDLYIQDLNVSFDASILGNNTSVKIGRLGYKISPYVFQRGDNTPYFKNDRWDSGEHVLTGGVAGFKFGGVNLDLFFGRTSGNQSVNGVEISPVFAGQLGSVLAGGARPTGYGGFSAATLMVDRVLGANVNVPLSDKGNINLSYIINRSNTTLYAGTANQVNAVDVMAATANYKFGSLAVEGGYSKSVLKNFNKSRFDSDNAAVFAKAKYSNDKWGLYAGYRNIGPNFGAAGAWGRIGMWWNPTDIEGLNVGGHFKLNEDLTLSASGEFLKGLGKTVTTPGGAVAGLGKDDKINSFKAGLDWHFSPNWNLMLGYERVEWDMDALTVKPNENWFRAGVGYRLSDNAKLSLLAEISDVDAKGVGYFNPFPGMGRAKGAFVTSQLSAKF
ncbi:MAG: hypothetical protein AMXMBFR81_06080 [Chthonomonas sp.]|nr:S-layer homology domain-containing protein [Fimbriimonadaceae bacterium]